MSTYLDIEPVSDKNDLTKRLPLSTQDVYNIRVGNTVLCKRRSYTENEYVDRIGEIIKIDANKSRITILENGNSKLKCSIKSTYGIPLNKKYLEHFGFNEHEDVFVNDKPLRAPVIATPHYIDDDKIKYRGYNFSLSNGRKHLNNITIANIKYLHQLENLMHFSLYQKRH